MTATVSMTSGEVMAMLRTRYAAPAWAIVEQVGNATGYATARHADAIAMGLWPSRGLEVLGFEVKVSRSDWTRELAQPDKAEPIAAYCDRWYIVAPAGVVPPFDVPSNWGLLEAKGGRLHETKPAEKLDAKPMGRPFVAAILRRVVEQTPDVAERAAIRAEIYAAYEREVTDAAESRASARLGRLEGLSDRVDAFENETGINLRDPRGWPRPDGKRIGQAVKAVLSGDADAAIARLEGVEQTALAVIEDIRRLRNEVGA